MSVLSILKYPDPMLATPTKEVDGITDEIIQLLEDMYETMVASDGIGIAAPQVNSNLRLAIVEIDEESGLFEMINPRIIHSTGETIDVEGCLSFPEVYGTIKRADTIVLRYYDRNGDEYEVEADDYLSRAFQHELEHLDGKLFTDKIIKKIKPEDLETYMEANLE